MGRVKAGVQTDVVQFSVLRPCRFSTPGDPRAESSDAGDHFAQPALDPDEELVL